MLWILEVDVSETPSRLSVYLESNYENPWGGAATYSLPYSQLNRQTTEIAFWILLGSAAQHYHGKQGGRTIRDVRVYHRVLTAAERVILANTPPWARHTAM